MRTLRTRMLTAMGAATLCAVAVSGAASAAPIDRGPIEDSPPPEVVRNFCDVAGLTVRLDTTVTGRFLFKTQGSEQIPHYMEKVRFEQTVTNLANGEYAVERQNTLSKDLRITDNGDGTFTILVLATGNDVVYDSSGKAIARNPGQVRFEVLIDNAGTPTDPSDDEFLDFLGFVKESTGRTDDYCTAVVSAIT